MGLAACTVFFCRSFIFASAAVLRSNRDKTHFLPFPPYTLPPHPPPHPPLPPSQNFPVTACSAVDSLLCRKSFTNSASCLPLPHRQTSHHLTYRNIHTSCTKDVKRHQKMISHQMRRGGGVHHHQQHTLVLVVTLYEVGRHCHYIQHHQ